MIALVKTLSGSVWSTLAVVAVVSVVAIAVVVNGFDLQVSGGLALYFVIWWILLFAVLPFGIRSQAETGEVVAGSEPGAPSAPALREKALWTTLLSAIVLVAVAAVVSLAPALNGKPLRRKKKKKAFSLSELPFLQNFIPRFLLSSPLGALGQPSFRNPVRRPPTPR